jgi:hypothetical protein
MTEQQLGTGNRMLLPYGNLSEKSLFLILAFSYIISLMLKPFRKEISPDWSPPNIIFLLDYCGVL